MIVSVRLMGADGSTKQEALIAALEAKDLGHVVGQMIRHAYEQEQGLEDLVVYLEPAPVQPGTWRVHGKALVDVEMEVALTDEDVERLVREGKSREELARERVEQWLKRSLRAVEEREGPPASITLQEFDVVSVVREHAQIQRPFPARV